MKEVCCSEARVDLDMLVCMSHNMNGASTASARKVGLQDSLYEEGNCSYASAVDSNIGFASEDSSSPGSSALCVSNRMLVPNIMAPLHRGDVQQNLVSMSHIFSSFRASQSMSSMSPVPPGSSHICRVCSKAFRASSLLDIHMRVHVGAKPFVCPMCGHRATQKGNLKLHMKKHHGAELPPHIDLVPDSGIWGHPQENILCSTSTQQYDGFDNNLDASGKRKQVAQAVSSLLNEEVVELIKKYQNDAGQGTAGTITESLEDFIRIAKNKSCADTNRMSTEEIGMPKKAREAKMNRKKKHLALSLRFQPYPKYPISTNSATTFAVARRAEILEHGTKCIICEKSLPSGVKGVGVQKLHICEVCLITQGYASLIPSLRVLNGKSARSDKKICFSNETGPATINNVTSEELEKKTSDERPSTCDSCGSILLDLASLKRHKKQCHAVKGDSSSVSSKEKFLFAIGLVPKTSVALKDTNTDVDVKQAIGLNPVLDHVMLFASKRQGTVEIPVNVPQYPVFAYSEVSPTCTNQKRSDICYKVERKRESHSPVRRRASPGVLNMLRKTLLNSADQREMARRELMPKSENIISSLPKDITEPALFGEPSKTSEYRNPAMRSLADIGKSMIKNTREVEYFSKILVDGPPKTIVLDHHEHENNGYKCPYCPKWFKYRSVLEIHVRSHTGERPYKCPYCEYAGTQHNCLKLHIQRHHPAKYAYNRAESAGPHHMGSISQTLTTESVKGSCFSPVNCPVCGRVSPSPGYLKIHMRSHKKSLDHVCHVCGRGFKEYWYLSTHLKTHERELNSLKLNIQQYNLLRSGGVASPSSDRFNSRAVLSKFPATPARHEDFSVSETSVTPRILKHEPTSTKHIFASASDIHHAWKREVETFPVSDFTIKTANSERMTDVGSSVNRSRRRKASCPSRVVSAPYSVPKSPIWKGVTPSQKFTETYRMRNVATQNTNSENIEGDLPLDLRCPAKKLNDKNNNDVPMNLCKT